MIIDILIDKILEFQNPTVVGLDPRLEYIPIEITAPIISRLGKTPEAAGQAILAFNKGLIDAIFDIVPVVKPQIAMYEQFGAPGIAAYIETAAYARSRGLVVIGDIKRGDIASTAEAYSDGHIGATDIFGEKQTIFNADFVTISPYLGADSVAPFLANCKAHNRGLFVLAKTSNPGSADLQNLTYNERPIYEIMMDYISKWGADFMGKYGYSSIGAVVGATHPREAEIMRSIAPGTFFLIPGYGAQGGRSEDLAVCFDKRGLGGIVNSSRGIIAAYQTPEYRHLSYAEAARAAALAMKEDLRRHINIGGGLA